MSRIGKRLISIPKGVEVILTDNELTVKGPKGTLKRKIHPKIFVAVKDDQISVSVKEKSREVRALHGLFNALIYNMVTGVTKGFEKNLEIVGVGYRVEVQGRVAVFNLGYSHPINYELPEGVDINVDKTKIRLVSSDKELLGRVAAKIRSFRKPEPFKGKGIKYADEIIRRKAGKAGAAK